MHQHKEECGDALVSTFVFKELGFFTSSVKAVHKQGKTASRPAMARALSPQNTSKIPDAVTQRIILEQSFDKRLVEGEFWYILVAEWLEQLKKYLGMQTRKFYHQRVLPGPIPTRLDYAHTVDVVHEDVWRMLVQWYGLAEEHKPMKLVVYSYSRASELEHNQNSFKVTLCNSPAEEFQITRFSKMEKVGHVEWRIRELYRIPQGQKSRLWAKPDSDSDWRTLFCRDNAIGKILEIDSDFTRPTVALEICRGDKWCNGPEKTEETQTCPSGPLYQNNIFEDVTSTWEIDIHDQIDNIGKDFVQRLHSNFSAFVERAKDYVDLKETHLRDRERNVSEREGYVEKMMGKVAEEEERLNNDLMACENGKRELDRRREEIEEEFAKRMEDMDAILQSKSEMLERERASFEMEKDRFESELKRMSELYKVQDGRVKLDIGGHQFTTSLQTLTRDPESMLAAMFSGRHALKTEDDGSYFIDRDGTHFRFILNYLRDGGIKEGTLPASECVLRELLTEAEYYQLNELADYLSSGTYQKNGGGKEDTFV